MKKAIDDSHAPPARHVYLAAGEPGGRPIGNRWPGPSDADEALLVRVLVLDQAPAAALGEDRVPFVGAAGDELVLGLQGDVTPGPVEVPATAPDGQDVEARVDAELQVGEARPVGRRA